MQGQRLAAKKRKTVTSSFLSKGHLWEKVLEEQTLLAAVLPPVYAPALATWHSPM